MAKKNNKAISFSEQLRRTTVKTVVYRTKKAPANYNANNPDPKNTFKGADGNWYKISNSFPVNGINCYAFATGWCATGPEPGRTNVYIPGFLVKKWPNTMEELVSYVEEDLGHHGRKVHKVYKGDEIPETLPEEPAGTYYIKIMTSDGTVKGFHMARKDKTCGRWVHKAGFFAHPQVFMRNKKIGGVEDALANPNVPEDKKAMIRSMIKNPLFKSMVARELTGVVESEYEDKDNASYFSFNPDRSLTELCEYKAYAVLLVDF